MSTAAALEFLIKHFPSGSGHGGCFWQASQSIFYLQEGNGCHMHSPSVTLSSYLIKKEAMRRELPRFPTVLGAVRLPWRVLLPTAAFSLCPESSLHIFHQHTNDYNSSHLATKTGPPSPSSHHLISLFTFTAEFLKEDVCIYCLHVL